MTAPAASGSPLECLVQTKRALVASIRLVALPSLGVSRARWLLSYAEPEQVVDCLMRGKLPPGIPDPKVSVTRSDLDRWQAGLASQRVDDLAACNLDGSHRIIDAGSEEWPFSEDPDPPILLFLRGRSELLQLPRRVAVVGTRRCSAVGRSVAGEIGWMLAEHGVGVVSGLALGIDGAAHRGAGSSESDPGRIGVVASGLDMVYPRSNRDLWESIAHSGLLVSETPMGERATRWRFPARNRLIAGLVELVVVVESHLTGGALLTVDEALGRSVDVVTVPGSVLSQSSMGTNQLLLDGIPPIRNGQDLVELLGLGPRQPSQTADQLPLMGGHRGHGPAAARSGGGFESEGSEQAVLRALEGGPASMDSLAGATGIEISVLLTLIQRLKRAQRVEIDGGLIAKALPAGR